MQKKVIHSSNLSLRFYERDGWTKPELDALCIKGFVHCFHPHDANRYYTMTIGTQMDYEKLLAKASKVVRAFDDNPEESDLEYLKKMGW